MENNFIKLKTEKSSHLPHKLSPVESQNFWDLFLLDSKCKVVTIDVANMYEEVHFEC